MRHAVTFIICLLISTYSIAATEKYGEKFLGKCDIKGTTEYITFDYRYWLEETYLYPLELSEAIEAIHYNQDGTRYEVRPWTRFGTSTDYAELSEAMILENSSDKFVAKSPWSFEDWIHLDNISGILTIDKKNKTGKYIRRHSLLGKIKYKLKNCEMDFEFTPEQLLYNVD